MRFRGAGAFTLSMLSIAAAWKPAPGHKQIPIWPGPAPDVIRGSGPVDDAQKATQKVAGKTWTYVSNVVKPTITVYPPKGRNTGAALVVFPGGGYTILAIDLEGTEVCDWATSAGMTCVLLKYRVPGVKYYPKSAPYPKSGPYPFTPMALQDAQRAMGLVRLHAVEWNIDPRKVGVIGFSAGGHLVAAVSTHYQKRAYKPVDRADEISSRPDFAIALYPGHLSADHIQQDARWGKRQIAVPAGARLNPDLAVTRDTPPTLLIQSEDDPVDDIANSREYYAALKNAGVAAEIQTYPHGGHAFGLRPTENPATHWPEVAEKWLAKIGVLTPSPASSSR